MSEVDTFLQPRDDAGQFAGTTDDVVTEPLAAPTPQATPEPQAIEPQIQNEPAAAPVVKQEMTDKERAFMAAAKDERNKRQELERRLQEIEAQQNPPKEFWEAPEERLQQFEARIQHNVLVSKMDISENLARSRYQDFDEKVGVFKELLENTPGLIQQFTSALDPAEFAYRTSANYMKVRDAGSIDGMRSKIEAEVRAKVEAEYREKELAREKKLGSIPNSVSNITGSGASSSPVWNGPTPLDSVLA